MVPCSFADMLKEIDTGKAEMGVTGYGLSVTTMEEVFLRISEGNAPEPSNVPVVRCLERRSHGVLQMEL